jgi:hypothetical protein
VSFPRKRESRKKQKSLSLGSRLPGIRRNARIHGNKPGLLLGVGMTQENLVVSFPRKWESRKKEAVFSGFLLAQE